MILEGAGFEVIDLGVDVSSQRFVQEVAEHQPEIVAMSALLTTTMHEMGSTLEALHEAGLRESVKVIVGSAPLSADLAAGIGADGYSPDAGRAMSMAKGILGRAPKNERL
jgi:5-methyltetrahydrofolate--homocysteine methyltransferase